MEIDRYRGTAESQVWLFRIGGFQRQIRDRDARIAELEAQLAAAHKKASRRKRAIRTLQRAIEERNASLNRLGPDAPHRRLEVAEALLRRVTYLPCEADRSEYGHAWIEERDAALGEGGNDGY